jgi:hypothetical protein
VVASARQREIHLAVHTQAMGSSFIVRRVRGILPFGALVVVALVAVATAMTILGDSRPNASPSPSPSDSPTPIPIAQLSPIDTPTEVPSPLQTVALPSTAPVVLTIYLGEHDPKRVWFVVWRYPQLRTGSTPMAAAVNRDIVDEVRTRIDAWENGPAAVAQKPGKTNNLTGTFSVDLVSYDLVSLTLRWVDDTSAVHPATNIETLTYALNSGERLNFGQVFSDEQAALTIIATQARAQLSKSLGADYDPTIVQGGTEPVGANYTNWALTRSGLRVTFAEYQVGNFGDGLPAVLIPWSSLRSALRTDGPASRLTGAAAGTAAPS